jgi:hypothetical protein
MIDESAQKKYAVQSTEDARDAGRSRPSNQFTKDFLSNKFGHGL